MSSCCICQFRIRNARSIFEEKVSNPPVLIATLVLRLAKGTRHKFEGDSAICRKCCDKVLRWHNALKVAKQRQRELLQLLEDAGKPLQYEPKEKEEDEDENSEVEQRLSRDGTAERDLELSAAKEIIKLECNSNDNEDLIENTKQDLTVEDRISPELNKLLRSKIETADIEFVVENEYFEDNENFEVFHDDDDDNGGDDDYEGDADYDENVDIALRQRSSKKTKKLSTTERVAIKCTECDMTFKTQRQCNAHAKKDHFAGFICDQCGKTLHSYSGFWNHRENHNPVKAFECSECGERFQQKNRLQHHMAWHSGEKPYQCEICAKRFVHRVALQKHKVIHDDSSRRIECGVCGFRFRTKPHLTRHMATHTGAKPHSCPVCGKCFAQLYNMRVHVKEHEQPGSTRQRRHKCKKCARTFTNKENYQEHCDRGDCETAAVTAT